MSRRARKIQLILALTGLVLVAASAWIGVREYRVFLTMQQPMSQPGPDTQTGTPPLVAGWAYRTQWRQLDRCATKQLGITALLATDETRISDASACLALAAEILRRAPTLSPAHFAVAVSSYRLGDLDVTRRALASARLTARNEGWQADRRMQLALLAFDSYPPDIQTGLEQDIDVLIRHFETLSAVSRAYVAYPHARAIITAQAEKQSPEIQEQFLTHVRQLTGSPENQG